MAVKTAPASYFRLVERFPLASIRDDAHLKRAQAILDELLRVRPDKGTELYLDALTDLVERYEAVHEPARAVSEADVLRELMRSNRLTQKELESRVGITQFDDLGRPERNAIADETANHRTGQVLRRQTRCFPSVRPSIARSPATI